MKKTKWLVLLSLMLCATMLMASCGSSANIIEDVYAPEQFLYEDDGVTPTKSEALSTFTGWNATEIVSDILMFTKSDSIVLYNINTAAQIYSISTTATLDVVGIEGYAVSDDFSVIWVTTEEIVDSEATYKTVLYDANGKQLATSDRSEVPEINLDLILFDSVCYRVAEDGSFAKAFDYASISDMPDVDCYNDTYYYDVTHEMISVYDKTLKLVNVYSVPNYVDESIYLILNDGNILVQTTVLQPDDSKDYTYVEDGSKYLVTSVVFDVEKGDAEEVDLSYVMLYGCSRTLRYGVGYEPMKEYSKDLENIVFAYDIVDDRIDTSASARKAYAIGNDGDIDAELSIYFTAQGANLPEAVAPDRYIIENVLGQITLFNKDGNVIGDVTNADFYETYMIAGGKIYDYNLKVVYDYENDDMVELAFYAGCALFDKEGETYLFSNGKMTKLIDEENMLTKNIVTKDQYFVVVDTTNLLTPSYDYYNDAGTKFATSSQMLFNVVAVGEKCIIVSGVNTALENVYYSFGE